MADPEETLVETLADPPAPPEVGSTCPTCHQRVRRLNPHRMDASKVHVLRDIARVQRLGHEWVYAQEDRRLRIEDGTTFLTVKDSRVHAQRLRYFGLLRWRERRSGAYQLTDAGHAFLRRELSVPARIWCRDGHVVECDAEHVTLTEIEHVVLDQPYWDAYPHNEQP